MDKLGEDNPITHELNFMLALMARREAAEPAERERLVGEMQVGDCGLPLRWCFGGWMGGFPLEEDGGTGWDGAGVVKGWVMCMHVQAGHSRATQSCGGTCMGGTRAGLLQPPNQPRKMTAALSAVPHSFPHIPPITPVLDHGEISPPRAPQISSLTLSPGPAPHSAPRRPPLASWAATARSTCSSTRRASSWRRSRRQPEASSLEGSWEEVQGA